MSRMSRPLVAIAVFAFASLVRADSLRLIAPAQGTTLRGGSFAELRWSAAKLPAAAEEWEAFLSIDGGKYYAFRVTPHLEIDRRSFTFIVPNVDTRAARILIRVGDEVRETHFEAHGTFAITRDPKAELLLPLRPLSAKRGEAAREGDPGVVFWVDGARNGSGLTSQSSTSVPSRTIDRRRTIAGSAPAEDASNGNGGMEPPSLAGTLRVARNRQARRTEPLTVSDDLLLVCRRRNI
jgi:hypothetical protein